MKTICICGGGALGSVIAAWLSAKGLAKVNLLTSKPEEWASTISADTPEGTILQGSLNLISSSPSVVIPASDIVLLCLPGYLIAKQLEAIKPYLSSHVFVGSVFSSTGFFFEAQKILSPNQPLWGFQRVPFICRVNQYGKSSQLLGYKPSYHVAVENVSPLEKEAFVHCISDLFERPTFLLKNYYEASLTNSNPLLHTARLYDLFGGENEGKAYTKVPLFYEEWTPQAAQTLIDMDKELFQLLAHLPVSEGFLPTILDYYESKDAYSLAEKISSIKGFKGILSPMKKTTGGWEADYTSRYFTEDFPHGLRYIKELAEQYSVYTPTINKIYNWGISKL